MTRKDYERIAGAIRQARSDHSEMYSDAGIGDLALDAAVERLCETLGADNPNFDRTRFEAACRREETTR